MHLVYLLKRSGGTFKQKFTRTATWEYRNSINVLCSDCMLKKEIKRYKKAIMERGISAFQAPTSLELRPDRNTLSFLDKKNLRVSNGNGTWDGILTNFKKTFKNTGKCLTLVFILR